MTTDNPDESSPFDPMTGVFGEAGLPTGAHAFSPADVPLIEARGYYRNGRGKYHCEILVIHMSAGWGNEVRLGKFFQNPKRSDGSIRSVSANMGIGRTGGIALYAPPDAATWHAGGGEDWDGMGQVNRRSFGIELCNRGSLKTLPTRKSLLERTIAGWQRAQHRKSRNTRYWENFPRQQIVALVSVIPWVKANNPHLAYVTGHEDLVGGKMDPGPLFPWSLIDWNGMGLVRMERDFKAKGDDPVWYEHVAGERRRYTGRAA